MKIRFVGEGITDVGSESQQNAAGEGGIDDDGGHLKGVIPILTQRTLAKVLGHDPDLEPDLGHLFRFHRAKGFSAKAKETILEATRQGLDGIAIVVDRDGADNRTRLSQLKEGRKQAMASNPEAIPVAVGVAVEVMEAWLLADEHGIERGLKIPRVNRAPDPEKLYGKRGSKNHPKAHLNKWLSQGPHSEEPAHLKMGRIAREVDLEILEQRCDKGFKPFADEVREHLVPLFT